MNSLAKITLIITSLYLLYVPALYAQTKDSLAYTEILNISYYTGTGAASSYHKLNLVLPKGKTNMPLLLWIGGGAWSYVDRHQEMELARKIAGQGIAVASVGHRLSPATWKDPALNTGIQHPEHIKDIAKAFKWLYDHASQYGYSQNDLFVGGFSSGGHLAALLGLDHRYLKAEGSSIQQIKGIIPMSGTYDIPHYYQILSASSGQQLADSHVKGVFGNSEKDFLDASPTTYLQNLSLPMLLISDTNTYPYAKFFEDKIKATGFTKLQVLHSTELKHGELWKNLSFADKSKYRDTLVDFINSHTTF
jgi:predicted esterase